MRTKRHKPPPRSKPMPWPLPRVPSVDDVYGWDDRWDVCCCRYHCHVRLEYYCWRLDCQLILMLAWSIVRDLSTTLLRLAWLLSSAAYRCSIECWPLLGAILSLCFTDNGCHFIYCNGYLPSSGYFCQSSTRIPYKGTYKLSNKYAMMGRYERVGDA